jgi:hypothetical protein
VRKVTAYWAALMAWVLAAGLYDGWTLGALAFPLSMLTVLAVLTVGTLAALAWGSARSAIFTVTSERLIVRFGMALRMSLNLPFGEIDSVGLRRFGDGTGDIPIALRGGRAFSWLVLWPFVRPWRIAAPEIMLRGLPEADQVAELLSGCLRAAAAEDRIRPAPASEAKAAVAAKDAGAGPSAALPAPA